MSINLLTDSDLINSHVECDEKFKHLSKYNSVLYTSSLLMQNTLEELILRNNDIAEKLDNLETIVNSVKNNDRTIRNIDMTLNDMSNRVICISNNSNNNDQTIRNIYNLVSSISNDKTENVNLDNYDQEDIDKVLEEMCKIGKYKSCIDMLQELNLSCCICYRPTADKTICKHSICKLCLSRLRVSKCPICRFAI
jgi:hypothetical protein